MCDNFHYSLEIHFKVFRNEGPGFMELTYSERKVQIKMCINKDGGSKEEREDSVQVIKQLRSNVNVNLIWVKRYTGGGAKMAA